MNFVNQMSAFDYDVLTALQSATDCEKASNSDLVDIKKGWFTATQLVEFAEYEGPNVRPSLSTLGDLHAVDQRTHHSLRLYRLNQKGRDFLSQPRPDSDEIVVSSYNWTGVVDPVQVKQVITILHDMEDVCEQIRNNQHRAQIFGLIRALEVLLTVPEPPRQGVLALVRDPAFSNIMQAATFLAAIAAAIRP